MIKQTCDNCGKEIKSLNKTRSNLFFVCPNGESWKNYRIEQKIFCSRECRKEYGKENLNRIKEIATSKDSWKFKISLLKKNLVSLVGIVMGIIIIIFCSYILIKILINPQTYSPSGLLVGITLGPIIFFIIYIIYLINHPWVIPNTPP